MRTVGPATGTISGGGPDCVPGRSHGRTMTVGWNWPEVPPSDARPTAGPNLRAHRAHQAQKKGLYMTERHAQAPTKQSVRSQTAEQKVKKIADDSNKTSNKTHDDSPYEG